MTAEKKLIVWASIIGLTTIFFVIVYKSVEYYNLLSEKQSSLIAGIVASAGGISFIAQQILGLNETNNRLFKFLNNRVLKHWLVPTIICIAMFGLGVYFTRKLVNAERYFVKCVPENLMIVYNQPSKRGTVICNQYSLLLKEQTFTLAAPDHQTKYNYTIQEAKKNSKEKEELLFETNKLPLFTYSVGTETPIISGWNPHCGKPIENLKKVSTVWNVSVRQAGNEHLFDSRIDVGLMNNNMYRIALLPSGKDCIASAIHSGQYRMASLDVTSGCPIYIGGTQRVLFKVAVCGVDDPSVDHTRLFQTVVIPDTGVKHEAALE